MGGHNLPPDRDRINISENLGKAAALPALPLITSMTFIDKRLKVPKGQKLKLCLFSRPIDVIRPKHGFPLSLGVHVANVKRDAH